MKLFTVIFLFLFSSCIIIPLPEHREEGRVFIRPEMIRFIVPGQTSRQDVLLTLGNPDAVALHESVLIYTWTPTVAYAGVAGVGYGASAATNINKKEFYLVLLDSSNRVIQHEIFHHNIDKKKKPLIEFIREWSTGKLTGDVDVSD